MLHDTFSGSLTKLMAGKIPEFETGLIKFYKNDKILVRKYFYVTDMKEAIRDNLLGIFETGLFQPSSCFTTLDNSYIILRFGGEKRGHFMKFKFGVTVMN